MKLNAGMHLAYCTNVHRGETWAETFESLKNHTLRVRDRVCPEQPCGISLRLSNLAAHELSQPTALLEFRRWLDHHHCYVFTINGFPFGQFHGSRVKEQVYEPDWTSPERVAYTNLLFDLLARLVPPDVEGSISSLPGSYKGFYLHADELKVIRHNVWRCVEHGARVSEQTGRRMHLDLVPEPLCVLESSGEILQFFERLRAEHPRDPRLAEHLGVSYDACHFAVEFEEPQNTLGCLQQHGIRIGKIQVSSALRLRPTPEARAALAAIEDDGYLHQVVVCRSGGERSIYPDVRLALAGEPQETEAALAGDTSASSAGADTMPEWRIHFHVPLNQPPAPPFDHTIPCVFDALDWLGANPVGCAHWEVKTFTWDLLPPEFRNADLADQLAGEYDWTLTQLAGRGLVKRG